MPAPAHFAYPFNFVGGRARTVEQGSPEEVIDVCVRTILLYPLGSRPLVPEFGTEDQAFEQGNPDLDEIRAAIAASEPRAAVDVDLDDQRLTDLAAGVAHIRVTANVMEGT